jgi:signal recognition particle subunit SEC65
VQDISIPDYFSKHAPKAGKKVKGRNLALDILTQNEIKTMRELCGIDYAQKEKIFYPQEIAKDRERFDAHFEANYIVNSMCGRYSKSVRAAELLAAGEVLISEYFMEHAPPESARRIANGLNRADIETMDALCYMPVEKLCRVRNIGEKSLEIILLLREGYAAEHRIVLA